MTTMWRVYRELLILEYPIFRQDFAAIYERVRNSPLQASHRQQVTVDHICRSVDLAAALYFKQVRCLQRSAATACLLKNVGFPAEMVVGVQQTPFLAHAWVELDGRVVNDKPYMSEIYQVLARC
jgi:Transglutaminase-like superfamily